MGMVPLLIINILLICHEGVNEVIYIKFLCRTFTQGLINLLPAYWSKTIQNNVIVAAIVIVVDIVRLTMTSS